MYADKLDPFNVVGMGHTLRVETPPIQIDTIDLQKSIEGISVRNLSTSTPKPSFINKMGVGNGMMSQNSNYNRLNSSFPSQLPRIEQSLCAGVQDVFEKVKKLKTANKKSLKW